MLGHFMAPIDGGVYADIVSDGDVHWANLEALGIADVERNRCSDVHEQARNAGKLWLYSFLYGCGEDMSGLNYRAAYVAYHGQQPAGTLIANGRRSRKTFKKNLPALAELEKMVKEKATANKRIKGIDGRWLTCRSAHYALNTLLQSAGALVMKQALVEFDRSLQEQGLTPGKEYEHVMNCHDEFQCEVLNQDGIPQLVADTACASLIRGGEFFNIRTEINGEAHIGSSWKYTH
jgi:DNA polymerase I-like protein with 3'-5' exonuclease and polymerase domains